LSRAQWTATLLILVLAAALSAGAQITPTTTLAAETGNNTAASNLFTTSSNGDVTPLNVSKVDTHSLLYAGFNGQIYVHLMGWFCQNAGSTATGGGTQCGSHVQVGYNSADATQVAKQINDMISRGINGAIHDWYGHGSYEDRESLLFLAEAEKHAGFQLAIMIDKGVNNGNDTQSIIQHVQYISQTYFPSPAYMRWNGHPVVTNFGLDSSVNWAAVAAAFPGTIFLFQDNAGFTQNSVTSGSYSWVMPDDANYGLNYLDDFYNTGQQYPNLYTVGAMYKGFNDTIASWSANRIMDQQCGQTWLQTFAHANSYFSSSNQLPAIQLVTWDDYEEGTEIETGIDNCVTVQATVAGTVLSWTLTGAESTIDHYQVFISTDGQNLAPVGDVPAGTRQLDLATYTIPAGNYTLYVKAVGKPSLRNQMSNAVSFTLAASTSGGPTPPAPPPPTPPPPAPTTPTAPVSKSVSVSASPTTASMTRGQSAQFQLAVAESGASDPVSLSCGNLPAGMTCAFSSATVTPGATAAAVTLTVSAASTMAAAHPRSPGRGLPVYALWMWGFGVAGLCTLPEVMRRKRRLLLLAVVLGFALLQLACGGGGAATSQMLQQPTVTTQSTTPTASTSSTYTVTVTATSGTVVSSTNLAITVQ